MIFLKALLISSFILSFALFVSNSDAIFVNEFMPSPNDTCSQCSEWMEVTSDQNESLENITVDTGETALTRLNGTILRGEFIIITRNMSVFSDIWKTKGITFFENSKMRLTDAGDKISVFNDTNELQHIEYSNAIKNVSYGLCGNITVRQNTSTPGFPNICSSGEKNETSNQTNATSSACDFRVWIDGDQIFTSENHEYSLKVEDNLGGDYETEVEYWIEDMFGEIVRSKVKTNNTGSNKSWEPPDIVGTEAYVIRASITGESCNDTDMSNNYAEKIVVYRGKQAETNSNLEVLDVGAGKDNMAKFGDVINIRMNVFKGNTGKSAIDVWLENADGIKLGRTSFSVYDRFSNYSLAIPLQINPNCGQELPGGTYFVKAEGIDSYDEEEIAIQGESTNFCKTKTIQTSGPCSCTPCNAEKKNDTSKNTSSKKSEKITINETGKNITNKTNVTGAIKKETISQKENQTQNESNPVKTSKIPTGSIVSKTGENWFSSSINGMLNFFKNLFKL
jgi:hypothetical protein